MNVRLSLVVIAALALDALDLGVAQSKAGPSSKILALETKWNEAYKHGDVATMESLLADDFVITVEDGRTFSKSGHIAHNADSALHVEISDMAEVKVRMHGSVAVVTGAYHEKGTSKGRAFESRDRAIDVWMRNANGGWQVIAAHYSIPASQLGRFEFHGSHPSGTATA
jgi:ketosteroid isomerase-like protein